MLYYKNNQWHISTERVEYKQDGAELENYVGSEGRDWWTELAIIHEDIKDVVFISMEISDEQVLRLEEVNNLNISEGHSSILGNYVKLGTFPDLPNHILRDLQFTKMFNIMLGVE